MDFVIVIKFNPTEKSRFYSIIVLLQSVYVKYIVNLPFVTGIWPHFQLGQQQDAHEFFQRAMLEVYSKCKL